MTESSLLASRDGQEATLPRPTGRIVLSEDRARNKRLKPRRASLRRMVRTIALVSLDFLSITASFGLVVAIGDNRAMPGEFASWSTACGFGLMATAVLVAFRLYRRSWRFFSFRHAAYLAMVGTIAMAASWIALAFYIGAGPFLRQMFLAQLLLAIAAMMGLRALRRFARESLSPAGRNPHIARNAASQRRALLVGSPEWAQSVTELLRKEQSPSFTLAGILLPSISDPIDQIGGVKVLGSHDMLVESVTALAARGQRPSLVIASDDGMHLSPREMARLTHRARELGLELSRVRDCWSHILQRPETSRPQELSTTDLLGRTEYEMDGDLIARQVKGQRVLVTGAGGTIGGELCWQLASFGPSSLILVENCEFNLYAIEMRLRERYPNLNVHAELCDVRRRDEVRRVFEEHGPAIIYHAAALKHVPIVEANPSAGVHTNILGTRIVADAVCEFGARAMVQVSTDKAVNPVGMMGATKRVGELYCQALDLCGVDDPGTPRFMTVRFGNVLGSSGSVLPLFKRQLEEGKPLTVTHPDIERFFMTVREAVQLILQSTTSAMEKGAQRGTIFVLDMGKPVRIVDFAYRLIQLYGLEPEIDVPIEFVGLRPGEKLYEELFDNCEEQIPSRVAGIFEAQSQPIPLPFINKSISRLATAVEQGDHEEARRITHHLVQIPNSGTQFDIAPSAPIVTGPRSRSEHHIQP